MIDLPKWLLAGGCAVALAGFGGTAAAHEGHDGTISASKLARNAKDLYGQTVTVSAEVEDVLDAHSFTLDEDAVFAGPDVLVLLPTGSAMSLRHDQKVVVTGRVRPYVMAELKHDYDWFDEGHLLNRETKVEYEKRPVLVATSVRSADGRDLVSGSARMTDDSDAATESTRPMRPRHDAPDVMISATTLVKDPKAYYGQTVTVQAEVEDVLSANAFTLDEDAVFKGPDVLVLVPAAVASSLAHDQKVTVTGTVRPWVVADLDRDYDFFKHGEIVSTKTKVDWKTRPVVVATRVMTPDGRDLLAR
jgi:hypothetical protein